MDKYLLFRKISERLSPPWESLVALRLPAFAPFEFGVGIGIHNELELSSALVSEAVASAPLAVAALAAAAGTLLFVAV